MLAGLFAVSRCAVALAGMDIGTAFGGIGASRSTTFAVFAEPAFLLVVFTLALLTSTTNLDVIAGLLRDGALGLRVSLALVLLAAAMVALVETGRLPADNPATHLELTMVHEAMVLEYSGWHLALIEAASALKLLIWLSLLAVIFLPAGIAPGGSGPLAWLIGLAAWVLKIGVMAAGLAVFETATAKMRVFRVPEFLGVALLLGLLAAVLLFVSQGFA
ncbi:MAG: NADH-quinone oxidoreductase subunit H [Acetobacteraceae bacterium]